MFLGLEFIMFLGDTVQLQCPLSPQTVSSLQIAPNTQQQVDCPLWGPSWPLLAVPPELGACLTHVQSFCSLDFFLLYKSFYLAT